MPSKTAFIDSLMEDTAKGYRKIMADNTRIKLELIEKGLVAAQVELKNFALAHQKTISSLTDSLSRVKRDIKEKEDNERPLFSFDFETTSEPEISEKTLKSFSMFSKNFGKGNCPLCKSPEHKVSWINGDEIPHSIKGMSTDYLKATVDYLYDQLRVVIKKDRKFIEEQANYRFGYLALHKKLLDMSREARSFCYAMLFELKDRGINYRNLLEKA